MPSNTGVGQVKKYDHVGLPLRSRTSITFHAGARNDSSLCRAANICAGVDAGRSCVYVSQARSAAVPKRAANDSRAASVVNVAAVLDSGWFHDSSALPGAIILAIVLALLVIVAKRFVARGQRAQIVYPVTVLVFLPVLFVFFGYLTRLMPVNM